MAGLIGSNPVGRGVPRAEPQDIPVVRDHLLRAAPVAQQHDPQLYGHEILCPLWAIYRPEGLACQTRTVPPRAHFLTVRA